MADAGFASDAGKHADTQCSASYRRQPSAVCVKIVSPGARSPFSEPAASVGRVPCPFSELSVGSEVSAGAASPSKTAGTTARRSGMLS